MGVTDHGLRRRVEDAMWARNERLLWELTPCRCCCSEHTFEGCPARLWAGCRGQGSMTRADLESWIRHYATHHDMTREEFFGETDPTGHDLPNG